MAECARLISDAELCALIGQRAEQQLERERQEAVRWN